MPYEIRETDAEFCVHKVDDDESLGCHETREDAEAQIAAIEAAEAEAESKELPIPQVDPKVSMFAHFKAFLASAISTDAVAEPTGFKAYGDRWCAWWTNNFKDRDGEYFTAKAIDDYIARVDVGVVPMPELWTWHLPGTKHGQADWMARIGHYCLASGTFDDTEAGRAAQKAYSRQRQPFAMSHGFTFDVTKKEAGVFHQFNTFEISTLPPKAAANPYTVYEEADIMLTPEKVKHLETLFGKDVAAQIIADTEAKSKAIEDLNVEFKEFVDMTPSDADASKEAIAHVEADLKTLIPDIIGDSAEGVRASMLVGRAVKALEAKHGAELEALKTTVAAQQEQIKQLLEAHSLRPRSASQSSDTLLEDDAMKAKVEATLTVKDEFWGLPVKEVVK